VHEFSSLTYSHPSTRGSETKLQSFWAQCCLRKELKRYIRKIKIKKINKIKKKKKKHKIVPKQQQNTL
jgi:hypothetical protein